MSYGFSREKSRCKGIRVSGLVAPNEATSPTNFSTLQYVAILTDTDMALRVCAGVQRRFRIHTTYGFDTIGRENEKLGGYCSNVNDKDKEKKKKRKAETPGVEKPNRLEGGTLEA